MKSLPAIIIACLFLGSCEEEFCWKCEIKSKITGEIIVTQEICGKTESEIAEWEREISTISLYERKCVRYMN